jgi:hypothetical protein
MSAVGSTDTGDGVRLPVVLQLLVAVALGLMLLVVALVLAPARALPRPMVDRLDGRRESLVFTAIAALGLCLALCLLVLLAAA